MDQKQAEQLVKRAIVHSIHCHSLPNKFLDPPNRHPESNERGLFPPYMNERRVTYMLFLVSAKFS